MDFMDPEHLTIAFHLLGAVAAGSVIGLERSYHGRPAGFRTHALVCLASSLLMLISLYQSEWVPAMTDEITQLDPTRMAQGIMTGIGFLGAGVIYKEDFTIRGLTTAASIWITAAIGILIGIGFYFPAILTTALAFGILSIFRRIETVMPTQYFTHYMIAFDRDKVMSESELRNMLKDHGFSVTSIGYRLVKEGVQFEYRTVIETTDLENAMRLANTLRKRDDVREFQLSPNGEK
jgi:putative Mg2+ transporter-C (MgtC) family protein